MLEAAEADLALEAGFVLVKARQGFPEIWVPSSSTRTNGVSGFAMAASVLSRAARRTSSTQAGVRGWDLEFESGLLHRRVHCEPNFLDQGRALFLAEPEIRG